MKLYALPENVLSNVVAALQELPYKSVSKVLLDISQKAQLVVDNDQKPIEIPDTPVAPTAPEVIPDSSQAV